MGSGNDHGRTTDVIDFNKCIISFFLSFRRSQKRVQPLSAHPAYLTPTLLCSGTPFIPALACCCFCRLVALSGTTDTWGTGGKRQRWVRRKANVMLYLPYLGTMPVYGTRCALMWTHPFLSTRATIPPCHFFRNLTSLPPPQALRFLHRG